MISSWICTTLGEALILQRGFDLPQDKRVPGVFPIISSSGENGSHHEYKVSPPGIVTGRYGTIGNVFYIDRPFWPLNTTLWVKDFRGNNPRYLSYLLKTIDFLTYSDKAAVPGVNRNHLHTAKIVLPPLLEQKSIATILGSLDDKIDLNRRMNETLEAMARAIFKDWFVDFGPTRAKMEGRAPYLAQEIWDLFPDRLDDEGKPEGWELKSLAKCFEIIGGGTPKTSVPEYWGEGIPWFSVVDTPPSGCVFVVETEKSITSRGLRESSARIVPAGTTIISARGTVGNLAMTACDMAFNQSCYALRGYDGRGDNFVFLAAQHMVGRLNSMAHGSVFSTITRQTFEAITLPVPGKDYFSWFESIVGPLFMKIKSNVIESRTLAQTRDLLLPKLMSGEIRVKDAEKTVENIL